MLRSRVPTTPYLLRLAARVHGDKEDLHDPLVADRQWHAEVAEGVEGHRHVATIRAHQRGLEETVESVHNHRIVPTFVVLPGLLSDLLWTVSWWVTRLARGRGNHSLGWMCMEARPMICLGFIWAGDWVRRSGGAWGTPERPEDP